MTKHAPAGDPRSLRIAASRLAYAADEVPVPAAGFGDALCLAATRRGLFAVGASGATPLLEGYYFGLAWREGALYVFQSCDGPDRQSRLGRILRFPRVGDGLGPGRVFCKGLDNGCHQIAFAGDELLVVDTHNQQVQRFDAAGAHAGTVHPVPLALTGPGQPSLYAHINSLSVIGDRLHLLLHNGGGPEPRPSEVIVFDMGWREVERYVLAGHGCHDVLALEDGTILHCGSEAGELIGSGGLRVALTERMTRGVAVNGDRIMVGASDRVARQEREEAAGSVIILDRRYRRLAEVELPGAPTCLVSLQRA